MSNDTLPTEPERALLRRLASGAFNNTVAVPADVLQMVRRGWVEESPVMSFPVVPQRHNYTLTQLGRMLLDSR